MDDSQLDDLTSKLQAADPDNPQPITSSSATPVLNDSSQPESTRAPKQNFAFATPSEMGLRETDPNNIPAAPRPQPGMTFTPTGGSVSNIHHQLNNNDDAADSTVITPTQPQ